MGGNDTPTPGTEQAVPPDLDAIRARCEAATPGPWVVRADPMDESLCVEVAEPGYRSLARGICSNDDPDSDDSESERPDLEFMAAARTDVETLLAEVERLRVVEVASIGAHALLEDAEAAIERVRALCASFDPTSGSARARTFVADLLHALDPVAGNDGPEVSRG